MLSLVPVLLLIAFQGPAALERFGTSERLPEALRALERVLSASRDEEASDAATVSGAKGLSPSESSKRYATLATDAALCAAIAQILSLEFADLPRPILGPQGRLNPKMEPERGDPAERPGPIQDGFLQNRRTRAGPVA